MQLQEECVLASAAEKKTWKNMNGNSFTDGYEMGCASLLEMWTVLTRNTYHIHEMWRRKVATLLKILVLHYKLLKQIYFDNNIFLNYS